MDGHDVIARLKEFEPQLRSRGVCHAALFGSMARGTADADSDIDILIDLDPTADLDIYDYVGLKTYIADLITGRVDVIDRNALRPTLKAPAESDAVYAF